MRFWGLGAKIVSGRKLLDCQICLRRPRNDPPPINLSPSKKPVAFETFTTFRVAFEKLTTYDEEKSSHNTSPGPGEGPGESFELAFKDPTAASVR
jgi:hypothetical protein